MSDLMEAKRKYLTHHNLLKSVCVLKTFCEEDDVNKLAQQHVKIIACVEHMSSHLMHILKHVDDLVEKLYVTSKLYRRLTFSMQLPMTDVEYDFYEQMYSTDYYTTLVNLQTVQALVKLCKLVNNTWELKLIEMMFVLKSNKETCSKIYAKVDASLKKAKTVLNSYALAEDILQNLKKDQQQSEIAEFCKMFYESYNLKQEATYNNIYKNEHMLI